MTNKQLYNLVFENFVQAKRELFKEGYTKKHLDEVDFNDIFENTKKKMLEEKVKSLQKENEMLKKKLQKESLMGSMGSTGGYETGGAGSETVWNFLTKAAAKLNLSRTAILDDEIKSLLDSGTIDDDAADIIILKIKNGINNGSITRGNIRNAIKKLIPQTLAESKKRRRY